MNGPTLPGSYDPQLVVFGFLALTLASYLAFSISGQASGAKPRVARMWLLSGALVMGTSVWVTHYLAMMAVSVPLHLSYRIPATFASLLITILVIYVGFSTVCRKVNVPLAVWVGGLLLGSGLAATHYLGTTGLQIVPAITYDLLWFCVSIVMAVGLSTPALHIAFRSVRRVRGGVVVRRSLAAVVMSVAVFSMHIAGMAASHFPTGSASPSVDAGLTNSALMFLSGAVVLVLLALALIPAMLAARWSGAVIGLRWKVFFLLAMIIGSTGAILELSRYRSIIALNDQRVATRMERQSNALAAEFVELQENLASQAIQLIGSRNVDEMIRNRDGQLPYESLAELEWLQVYDDASKRLVGWGVSGVRVNHPQALENAIQRVQVISRPVGYLSCREDCYYVTVLPVLDRSGTPLTVAIAGPIAQLLFDFRSSARADIVLLAPADESAARSEDPGRLWGYRIMGMTNAEVLGPQLQSIAVEQKLPAAGQMVAAAIGGASLRMRSESLTDIAEPRTVIALQVVDESASVDALAGLARKNLLQTVAMIFLSLGSLWLMLSFSTRKLTHITTALPLLADQQFQQASQLMARLRPSLVPDEVDQLLRTAQDLTHQLQRLVEVEAESSAKSRFLATMSHEIRTPINAILGMTEILARSPLDQEQHEQALVVHNSTLSLLEIINDILDFSKLEAGQRSLREEPFSPRKLVEGALNSFAGPARSKGLRIVEHIAPDVPASVQGDATRVRQILLNLLSNAVKFTERGRIWVSVTATNTIAGKTCLRCSVRDSGIGISGDDKKRLFKPFSQVESSTTRSYGGTGLGLSICHTLVQMMGGEIDVLSQKGGGSEFWFEIELPIDEGQAAPPAWPAAGLQGLRIALSVSDPDERASLTDYLAAGGASVRRQSQQEEAPVDLVIDDKPGGAMLRIAAPDSGHEELLHQPVHISELLRKVALVAGREAGLDPAGGAYAESGASAVPELSGQVLPELGCKVLVAEDNPVNQVVIETQLRRLHCKPTIVSSGMEALGLLQPGHDFDVLLTDLHMPSMDGYQLVREIRSAEAENGWERLPTIAFTADAASEVVVQCRRAGMDDVLTKPVVLQKLATSLAPWVKASATEDAPVDIAALEELLGGGVDQATLLLILNDFVRIAGQQFADLSGAIEQTDVRQLRDILHKLLGSTRSAGANRLAEILLRMQVAARKGDFAACQVLHEQECMQEFERVRQWVSAYQQDVNPEAG